MAKKIDALDYMNELDGWSTVDMQRTVGKMMRGVERLMDRIVSETQEQEIKSAAIRDLSQSLKAIADSMERYTGIYAWCMSQGTGGGHTTALEDVLHFLTKEETQLLHGWMARMENALGMK